jgi:predicted dehydrogenase
LLNQGVHTLDLLLACMGKPRRIYAEAKILAHQGIEVEDALVATIEFESGSLASLHATTNAYPGVETSLQIFGTKGSAQIVNDELSFIHIEDPRQPVGPFGINGRGNQRDAYVDFENRGRLDATEDHVPHLRQLKQIVVAIQNGALSEVQPQDAYVALATIRAAYVSSQLGRPLDLSQIIEGEYDDLAINFETAQQSETGSPNHG